MIHFICCVFVCSTFNSINKETHYIQYIAERNETERKKVTTIVIIIAQE